MEITQEGSGNPGATNVTRAVGRRAGWLVLLLDLLKGWGPAYAAHAWLGPGSWVPAATGLAAAVGHVAPVWHRFRGGKGVATGAGVLLALAPASGIAALVAYVAVRKTTRLASVASMAAALVGAAVTLGRLGHTHSITAMSGALLVLVVVRHIPNLRRLWHGEEPRT